MPNPGDALTALNSGAMDIIHNPFTNAFVAAGQGAPVRIIAGSGAGGLFLIAQKDSGIKSMADLADAKGKGLKIGTIRFNTFELTLYRALVKAGVAYSDYKIVWFNDTLSHGGRVRGQSGRPRHPRRAVRDAPGRPARRRAARQQPRCLGPAWSRLRDQHHGEVPREQAGGRSALSQGDAARRRRDQGRHAEGGRGARRRQVLSRRQGRSSTAALPRQMPQVDITKGGDKGMEIAVADMVQLGYLKPPPKIIDTTLLKQVLG